MSNTIAKLEKKIAKHNAPITILNVPEHERHTDDELYLLVYTCSENAICKQLRVWCNMKNIEEHLNDLINQEDVYAMPPYYYFATGNRC